MPWRELVGLYGPLIAWWCRRCRIDEHSVADCVQDVFASVAVALDTFHPKRDTGSFRAWLWTITRRKVLDCLRTQQRRPHAIGGSTAVAMIHEVMDGQSIPDEELSEALQIRELIDRALQQVRDEFENCTWQAFCRRWTIHRQRRRRTEGDSRNHSPGSQPNSASTETAAW